MFYNSLNLFECKNISLTKDTGFFAAFIQTAAAAVVGRQLNSGAKVHLTACPMEDHSGKKFSWIVTSILLNRTACYSFVSCMPFDRAFMAFDRTRLSIAPGIRSYSTFGRTPLSIVPSIRSYSPFGRTEHSVVLPIRSYRPCVSFGQRFNKKTAASI